jgi:hypothetical protein
VPVSVTADLPNGQTTSISLTFDHVNDGGETTVATGATGPPPPSGFKLTNPPVYFDIATTATFSGSVRVCLTWTEGQIANENRVRMFHHENAAWVDVTDPSSLNTMANTICGTAASLSPFALVEKKFAFSGFFAPVDNLPVRNSAKAGAAVPVRFSLGGDEGLDIFAVGYPRVQLIQCDTGASIQVVEETVTAGASGLTYDATTGRYAYIWKTERAWVPSCRQLQLRLNDGETYVANFTFAK